MYQFIINASYLTQSEEIVIFFYSVFDFGNMTNSKAVSKFK